MSLFSTYTQPGVYTTVIYQDAGVSLFGSARIPVLVGEGQEVFTLSPQELHRGSSNVADEQKVLEDLSPAIDGVTRSYTTTYSPVVKGDGTGTVTNAPTAIQAFTVDATGTLIPLTVTSLNGQTGAFQIAEILELGVDQLKVSYSFKRQDLKVTEDLSYQVPSFATYLAQTGATISCSIPGYQDLTLDFTSTTGKSDVQAVTGAGSNVIHIEILKADGVTVRTLSEIQSLFAAGIPTATAGNLTFVVNPGISQTNPAITTAPTAFSGGNGQNTNTTFKLNNVPVVDGSNGGVVTNAPKYLTVTVNGAPALVASLDGVHGLFTLASGVNFGDKLSVAYATNTYQNTFDILPANNVVGVLAAGYAPGRVDFVEGVDFILADDNIYWGNAFTVAQGVATPGYVPFDATVVTPQLADEKLFLVKASGVANNFNTVFTLPDCPTDGSGHGVVTDNPIYLRVYVGASLEDAYLNHPLATVTRLDGKAKSFALYTPPATGYQVYVTYWRNVLQTNVYALEVVNPGTSGYGSYRVTDQSGNVIPNYALTAHSVADANFAATGVLWPFGKSDMRGIPGAAPDEVITIKFQSDTSGSMLVPPQFATNTTAQPGVSFRCTISGVGPNGSIATPGPSIRMVSATACADSAAITVAGTGATAAITINVNRNDPANPTQPDPTNPTRTLGDIQALFAAQTITSTLTGRVLVDILPGIDSSLLCSTGGGLGYFTGGAAAVTQTYSNHFKVSSSRTIANAIADGKGITGGATTNSGDATVGADGWLGQTFEDPNTGVKFTLVDPGHALDDYGYTVSPMSYAFGSGDSLTFSASAAAPALTGPKPQIGVPGLNLIVSSTFGMNVGDTVALTTFANAGNQPQVGEFYYLTMQTGKVASDFAQHTYTNLSDITAAYGPVLPQNRISLGAQLFFQNGGSILTVRQVPVQKGLLTASEQDYMTALAEFTMPLAGSDRKADVFIPMTTSPTVQQFLAKQLVVSASPRMRGEAIAFLGLPMYATPDSARTLARGLASERVILVWPGSAALTINTNGVGVQYAVDGSFVAAAMAGLALGPNNDVATTLTGQKLVGFDHLNIRVAEPVLDLMAGDGITVLTEVPGALEVRHYLTTSTDSILMSEPTSTTAVDYTRKRMRAALKEFIGRKNVQDLVTDVQIKANSLLQALVAQGILDSYKGLSVTQDATDPTVLHMNVTIKPEFSVLWVDVVFNVTTQS